jgi:hypothetical protein
LRGGWRKKSFDSEVEQKHAPDDMECRLVLLKKVGNDGEPERCDRAVKSIGGCRAEAGEKAHARAFSERAANAEDADRPDRRSDGKTDRATLHEGEIHALF